MSTPSTASSPATTGPGGPADRFALSIRREKDGPEIKRVPVPDAYVQDFQQELLLRYALRRGMPMATLDDMKIEMTPVFDDAGSRCRGLRVDVVNPRGETFRQEYNAYLFSDVATRAAAKLVTERTLKVEDHYRYELVVAESVDVLPSLALTGISFGSGPKQAPLQFISRPLKRLMEHARPVGEPSEEHFSVFYTAEAYRRAETFARRGASVQPPRETGAAPVGTAGSCPESGDFFVVIAEALEATDAEEETASLSYTGKTWLRMQAVLKSIQSQPGTQSYRFLGQAHGHNFIPGDACEKCPEFDVCSKTSVFVSIDDRTWTQAIFGGAPYALCHIFGLSARQEQVHGLYSLHANRLTQRGFYIIPEFDPTSIS